ncbi:MAG TPA: RNA-binding protein, partial [Solibacterales bacterium]|nr:RNA-binding protein [Bryobacterales bacterium]
SNRSAIGARVKVTSSTGQSQYAVVSSAGSYLSSHDRRLVFGFGAAAFAKAEILWPGGKTQTLTGLAQGRYHQIAEETGPGS